MLAYWLLFAIFALGAILTRPMLIPAGQRAAQNGPVLAQPEFHGRATLLLAIAALVPTAMIGFRYEVGADWIPYELIFYDISYLDLTDALLLSDPGYAALNWMASAIGADIWAVNLACGAIFVFGLVRFASWQPNPWLAILVAIPYLVIGVGMGYSRQAVAIGLTMCALTSVKHGSIVRFILWMIAAALFHRSAIALIPIVALSYTRNRMQAVALGGVTVVVGWYLLIAPALDKFSAGYIDQVYEAQGASVRLAMNVVPALIFLAFSRRFGLDEVQRTVWRNISLVALAAFGAYFLIASSVVVDRLALYIIPVQLFVFSRLPYLDSQKGEPSFLLLFAVTFYSASVQFVWLNYANHAEYWLPYQLFPFGEDRVPARWE